MNNSAHQATSRPVDLVGDSPELVAFALLRYLAQLEQANSTTKTFDREWLLDAYSDCLQAVKGERTTASGASARAGENSKKPRAAR